MNLPDDLREAFARRAVEALGRFPDTSGQCVALCAYISSQLTANNVANKVALGSLSCNGKKAFQYRKPVPARPSASMIWDGHAWLEFPGGIIGEPSLFRTARGRPPESNLRQTLEAHGLIGRGAILVAARTALEDYSLKYTQLNYLKETAFQPLIDSLIAFNPPA